MSYLCTRCGRGPGETCEHKEETARKWKAAAGLDGVVSIDYAGKWIRTVRSHLKRR